MIIALNENKERVFVDDAREGDKYYCQVCGEPVFPKKGMIREHHFAHYSDTNCKAKIVYGPNSMTPWHKRMQGYFPVSTREVRFDDEINKDVHIADVYICETKTVIEFQHSKIKTEEFLSRTEFHINNGRRVIWIFDESIKDVSTDSNIIRTENPFWYQWKKPRRCLEAYSNPFDILESYGVFFFSGMDETDVIRRVLNFDKVEKVLVSPDTCNMVEGMNGTEMLNVGVDFIKLFIRPKTIVNPNIQIVQANPNRTYLAGRGSKEQYLHGSGKNAYSGKKSK